jgi:KTSC domain
MKIHMTPCKSSQIAEHGHDPQSNTLAIRFRGGGIYHYQNVTPADYAAFAAAESKGKHFGKHIKPHAKKYPFTKQGA